MKWRNLKAKKMKARTKNTGEIVDVEYLGNGVYGNTQYAEVYTKEALELLGKEVKE